MTGKRPNFNQRHQLSEQDMLSLDSYVRFFDRRDIEPTNEELVAEYQQLSCSERRQKRIEGLLTRKNIRYIAKIVISYFRPYGNTVEELMSISVWSMIRAIKKYNPEKGATFMYYASWYIRRDILNANRSQIKKYAYPLNEDFPIEDTTTMDGCPEEQAKARETLNTYIGSLQLIKNELEHTSPRNKHIVLQRLQTEDERVTLDIIREPLGISRERIRQIQNEELKKIIKKLKLDMTPNEVLALPDSIENVLCIAC